MTLFELIRQEVTAKQAAEVYGLRFDRSGRGFCPWHNDGKHAALAFYPDGHCYCHSCHNGGDATDIVAQMLGLQIKDAAERIRTDFHLNQPIDNRPDPQAKVRMKRQQDKKTAFDKRWRYLCQVVHEADARLAQYRPETSDAEFWLILAARSKADIELEMMWENMRNERTR